LCVALVSILTALPMIGGAPTVAAAEPAADESACPPPEVTHHYDTTELAVHVKLPASGCPSREHTMFTVSASIARSDDFADYESIERTVTCGPFRSADDRGPDEPTWENFCEVDVTLGHPEVETIGYGIDVGYPGAASARNRTVMLTCSSDGETAACDEW
jgi:hypothetical protein